ncbi:MAG: hypothetical protein DME98_02780 [Verrucomicrobia bacterium]|nr:MAG: hypothetical protein DME98_02780 [Verrucomicrobiota bacterium]
MFGASRRASRPRSNSSSSRGQRNRKSCAPLAGAPEIVALGELLRERRKNRFDLLRVPPPKTAATLVFGGDVILGRSCAAKIGNGIDPFVGIRAVLVGASFAATNLECTISNLGYSTQRYAFRAPARSAQLLRAAGFQAMGLANNHALDFGTAALRDCAASLSGEKIEPVGLGTPTGNACAPSFFSVRDRKKIAVLAISDVGPAAGSEIAAASDRVCLSGAIASARSRASLVGCMVHWGIENTANITDEQRELARWLVDHGVDLVVGSHPHRVQPLELEIGVNQNGKVSSASLIPLILETGLPRMDLAADKTDLGSAEGVPSSAAVTP